jgi:hypothetical protein
MAKKSVFMIITFLVIGLAVVPQLLAQTRQQQQELEQIARRSVNGLSAQDRQRVVHIMTDVYVAQGMSREQAASIAEMSADSMFSGDVGEMSAEERRQFEEQEQRLNDFNQRQSQPRPREPEKPKLPGQNAGWPAAQLRERALGSLRQPAGTSASYDGDSEWVSQIYLSGANANTFQQLKQQIETMTGSKMEGIQNGGFRVMYRTIGSGRMASRSYIEIYLEGNTITIRVWDSAA